MSLSLKKEQVLALVALAIGGAFYAMRPAVEGGGRSAVGSLKPIEYEAKPVVPAPLVTDDATPGRSDLFTQPRETKPLPPCELQFPPAPNDTVVALPLEPGPDFRHLAMLAIDGGVVEGVTLQTGGGADDGSVAAPAESAPVPQEAPSRAERYEAAKKFYDQVTLQGQNNALLGYVEVYKVSVTPPQRVDPFDAEKLTDFDGYEVRLRMLKVDEGKLGAVQRWLPGGLAKVQSVHLADSLQNIIERKKRAVPESPGSLAQRGELIEWLLDAAHADARVYDVALEQALLYAQLAGQGDLEGLRWQQRVLSARGDLDGLYRMYSGIQGPNRESAFRYQGLGEIAAMLGLEQDAERDLRKAVTLAGTDARPHAALADFLRKRGRSRDALAAALTAQRLFGGLQTRDDKVRVVRVIAACHLATGDVDGAKAARDLLATADVPPYLDGAIAYAAGNADGALSAFRGAGNTVDRDEAQLGEAACLIRLGQWQEAFDALHAVYDRAPLLRHRAAGAMSLLFQRLGNFDSALSWADRALEAAPTDTYVQYLRGRALRLSGQVQAAEDAITAALRSHDDFVHAVSEMARVFTLRSTQATGAEGAKNAFFAMRYSDRAVELAPQPRSEWFRLQGLLHYKGADPRGAMAAFQQARDTAADDPAKLFARGALAVVDYSLGHQDSADGDLQKMVNDLPKGSPWRDWADARIKDIYDHAEKEMLEDRFERTALGNIWIAENDGQAKGSIEGGWAQLRGTLTRSGKGEINIERAGAVQKGKNFLAVECRMKVGADNAADGFCGLRMRTVQGNNRTSDIAVGVQDGAPFVLVMDGNEEPKRLKPEVAGFERTGIQELGLRVVPKAPGEERTFVLQVTWNGQLLHTQELKSLGGSTTSEVKTQLFASASKGSTVHASFDEYRLERRKER